MKTQTSLTAQAALSHLAQPIVTLSKSLLIAITLSAALPHTVAADEIYSIGKLVIEKVFAFATPPGAMSAGGYLKITNTGTEDDTLIGGKASFANVTQVHQMKMVDQVMKMRHLENGLPIPAGESVELTPGGFHIMFMQLTQSLKEGDTAEGSLTFSKAGELPLSYKIIDRRKQMSGHDNKEKPSMNHGGESKHEEMKHDSHKTE